MQTLAQTVAAATQRQTLQKRHEPARRSRSGLKRKHSWQQLLKFADSKRTHLRKRVSRRGSSEELEKNIDEAGVSQKKARHALFDRTSSVATAMNLLVEHEAENLKRTIEFVGFCNKMRIM